jgi:transcriptional repressor NrdR
MVCIYCSAETRVTNSRLQKRSNSVWRRRHCEACGSIFSTEEHVDYEKSIVVQSSKGSFSPFLRDKLFTSIYRSLQHRSTALEDAIGITDTVIERVWKRVEGGKLEAVILATATQETLQRFDKAAAISYQAFHADLI